MPEARAQRQVVAAPAVTEHLDVARVGHPQAFEDLDRGGLAGAIRAEQAEALAGADLEVEAPDGMDVAVVLEQTATKKGRVSGHDGKRPD